MLPSFRAAVRALSLALLMLVGGLAAGTPGALAQTAAPEPAQNVLGMDVSGWQPTVDWPKAWADGARFVYVKSTEGTTYRNPTWASHTTGARGVGMRVGAYHFARPDRSGPVPQADFFVDNGGHWVADGTTLPPAADVEDNPVAGGDMCYDLTPSEMVAWVRAFVDRIYARTGRHPTIYTSTRWWRACTGDAPDFGSTSPLWLARWTSTIGSLPAGWAAHSIWQFADAGVFPGDQNRFNGGEDALRELALRQDSPLLTVAATDDAEDEPVDPGRELELRITGRNAGRSLAANVSVSARIPAGLSYVPGSLRTVAGAGAPAGRPTDGPGDDRGEYRADTREAVFRIGQAAAHDRGGQVAYDRPFELRFRVRVDDRPADPERTVEDLVTAVRAGWDAPLRGNGLATAVLATTRVRAPEPPVDPEGPENPGGPEYPEGPEQPGGPGQPEGPQRPGAPESPVAPDGGRPDGGDPRAGHQGTSLIAPPVAGPSRVATVQRPTVPRARISSSVLRLERVRAGGARGWITVRCAEGPCVGTLTVQETRRVGGRERLTGRSLARVAIRLRAGATVRMRITLPSSRVAALRRTRHPRLRLTAGLRGEAGARRMVGVRWTR